MGSPGAGRAGRRSPGAGGAEALGYQGEGAEGDDGGAVDDRGPVQAHVGGGESRDDRRDAEGQVGDDEGDGEQLAALDGFARVAGSRVKYVKPHGALYQTVVSDEAQASAVVTAVIEYDLTLAVLGLPGSAFLRLAERAGLRCVLEGFADRGYLPDGRLVPRSSAGALVRDERAVVARAVRMATKGEVVAVDGTVVAIEADSICVPGDTPDAAALARTIRKALAGADVPVAPFAR